METLSYVEKKIASDNERYYTVKISDVMRGLVYYGRIEKTSFSVSSDGMIDMHGLCMFTNTADGYANSCRKAVRLCPGTWQILQIRNLTLDMRFYNTERLLTVFADAGMAAL